MSRMVLKAGSGFIHDIAYLQNGAAVICIDDLTNGIKLKKVVNFYDHSLNIGEEVSITYQIIKTENGDSIDFSFEPKSLEEEHAKVAVL